MTIYDNPADPGAEGNIARLPAAGSWFAIVVLYSRSMRAGFGLQGEQRASPAVVKLDRTNFLQCLDIFGHVTFLKALP